MSSSRTDRPPRGRHRARNSLLSQFLWLASGRAGGALLQAVTLGLVARWVGPIHFGHVAGVVGAAQASVALADLGISPTLLRMRSTDPHDPRVRGLLSLNRRVSFVLLACWFGALTTAAAVTGDRTFLLLLGVAVWVAAEKNTETSLMVTLADGCTRDITLSLGLRRIVTTTLLVGGTAVGAPALLAYGCALAVSGILGWAWTWRRVEAALPATRPGPVRPLLRAALPFWLNSMAIQARNLDVVVVGLAASPAAAGLYAAPSRLSGPLGLLPSSLAQVLLPAAARGGRDSARQARTAGVMMTAVVMVLFGGLALVLGRIVPAVLGPGFEGAVTPLRILLVGLVFFGITASLVSVLQGRGDEWYVAWTNLAILGLCLPGVAVGAALAGASGAATAVSATYALQAGLLSRRASTLQARKKGRPPPAPVLLRAVPDRNGEALV